MTVILPKHSRSLLILQPAVSCSWPWGKQSFSYHCFSFSLSSSQGLRTHSVVPALHPILPSIEILGVSTNHAHPTQTNQLIGVSFHLVSISSQKQWSLTVCSDFVLAKNRWVLLSSSSWSKELLSLFPWLKAFIYRRWLWKWLRNFISPAATTWTSLLAVSPRRKLCPVSYSVLTLFRSPGDRPLEPRLLVTIDFLCLKWCLSLFFLSSAEYPTQCLVHATWELYLWGTSQASLKGYDHLQTDSLHTATNIFVYFLHTVWWPHLCQSCGSLCAYLGLMGGALLDCLDLQFLISLRKPMVEAGHIAPW